MSHAFFIAHTTSGRTRIRWAGDVTEKAKVTELAADIAQVQGVDNALPRVNTGSIIIEHDNRDWSELEAQLTEKLPLTFITSAPSSPRYTGVARLNQGLDNVDETLKGMNMDLSSLSVLFLLVMAITQALRGQVAVSSASLLWYAFSVASRARGATDTSVNSSTEPYFKNTD